MRFGLSYSGQKDFYGKMCRFYCVFDGFCSVSGFLEPFIIKLNSFCEAFLSFKVLNFKHIFKSENCLKFKKPQPTSDSSEL